MARNRTHIDAPPSAVWQVLSDPFNYPRWVVGTDRTLSADPTWPAEEAKFRVRVFPGYSDYTHAREVVPERRIVLDAAGGPFGAARVTIELEPEGAGTRVTMIEDPAGWTRPLHFLPPAHLAIRLRNVESLRRLRRLVEARRPDR